MPSEVIKRFKIHQIALSFASCEREDEEYLGLGECEEFSYRLGRGKTHHLSVIETEDADGEKIVIFRITIGLACRVFRPSVLAEAGQDADPADIDAACEVQTMYDADYIVPESSGNTDEFDSDDLKNFAEHNVPYHVWPFFREHLCSTLAKMHIQPITIPMLQVPIAHQKTKKKK